MPHNILFETSLLDYEPIIWQHIPIYKRYDYLHNYLSSELGIEYATLLTKPRIKNLNGSWAIDKTASSFQRINTFSNENKSKILDNLNQKLEQIQLEVQRLKNNEDKTFQDLGALIEFAFIIPDQEHIVADTDTLTPYLVGWGFRFDKITNKSYALLIKLPPKEKNTPPKSTPKVKALKKEIPEKPLEEPINSIHETSTNTEERENIKDASENDKKEGNQSQLPPQEQEDIEVKDSKDKNRNNKLLVGILGSLLLLALLAIVYLLNTDPQGDTPISNILPNKPDILPPIDTTKITIDKDDPLQQKIISNRLNIYLSTGTNIETFAKLFKEKYTNDDINIIYYTAAANRLMIECPAAQRTTLKKELLETFKYVEFVMDETIFQKEQNTTSFNDPGFKNNRQSWFIKTIEADLAWQVTQGDPNIVIAVIDNGFDLNHPEFQGQVIKPWNIPANNNKVNTGLNNMYHGTHVANTVGAKSNNQIGIAGIAPNCKVMPVQVGTPFGLMTTSSIVDGIFYAANNNATVINLSLGSSFNPNIARKSRQEQERLARTLYPQQEKFWTDLFKLIYDKGIVVVQAAGNSNMLATIDPMSRNPYTIKVTATNPSNQKANFSNFGDKCQLSAPGTQIFSAVPRGGFNYLDGTSMAAPMVSAGVALLKSKNPNLDPGDCMRILYDTGLPLQSDIGRLIQLGKALGNTNTQDTLPCADEINRLKEEIEQLKQRLPDTTIGLIIPEKPDDLSFADGIWKSTTDLVSSLGKKRVELYYEFYQNGSGTLTIKEEDGTLCKAPLQVALSSRKMNINQTNEAKCSNGMDYQPYYVVCQSNNNQVAQCEAVSKITQKKVEFQLIKVQKIQ